MQRLKERLTAFFRKIGHNQSKQDFQSSLNTNTMATFNYEVGGNEIKVDANEAINEIQHNKTMLVSQLTNEEPLQPEGVGGLTTIEDVFRHFKPNIEISMTNSEGVATNETFNFRALEDFTPKGIIRQSAFLNKLKIQLDQYNKITKQLKTNKVLQTMLTNPETKEALINVLRNAAAELENQQ